MAFIVDGVEAKTVLDNVAQQQIEAQLQGIAKGMQRAFPGIAFAVVLFPNEANGNVAYVSNAPRPAMIKGIQAWLKGVIRTVQ